MTVVTRSELPQPKPGNDEFYVAGRAQLIEDVTTRARVLQDARHQADASEVLFELDVDRVMHTRWEHVLTPPCAPSRRSGAPAPWSCGIAHCPPELLDDLGALFAELRGWPGVIEKTRRGVLPATRSVPAFRPSGGWNAAGPTSRDGTADPVRPAPAHLGHAAARLPARAATATRGDAGSVLGQCIDGQEEQRRRPRGCARDAARRPGSVISVPASTRCSCCSIRSAASPSIT